MLDAPFYFSLVIGDKHMRTQYELRDFIQSDGNVYLVPSYYGDRERGKRVCWLLDKDGVITNQRIFKEDMKRFIDCIKTEWRVGVILTNRYKDEYGTEYIEDD